MNVTNVSNNVIDMQSYDKVQSAKKNVVSDEAEKTINETFSNVDKAEFSLDYNKESISEVTNSIKDKFTYSLVDSQVNKSIVSCGDAYGNILDKINNSKDLSDSEKGQLTKILDNAYKDYTKVASNMISKDISSFVNRAYDMGGNYYSKGNKELIDEKGLQKNIEDMFNAAKVYYKNNNKEGLENYLSSKFSETTSSENLSFNDLKVLRTAISDSDKIPKSANLYDIAKNQQANMQNIINKLRKDGASSTAVNLYKDAANGINNLNWGRESFSKLRVGYENKIDEIYGEEVSETNKLKALKKKQKEMLEKYRKEMEKLHKEAAKMKMSVKELANQEKFLTKQRESDLNDLSRQQTDVQNNINEIAKSLDDLTNQYNEFMKNPAEEIGKSLEKETAFSHIE